MKRFLPLWQRETGAYFRTSIAYVGGVFFLLLTGGTFWVLVARLAGGEMEGSLTEVFFSSLWFWLAMLTVTPLLTMRLFAEEIRLGTLETLMSAPVTATEVVLSKFAAAGTVFGMLWLPTMLYSPVARWCGGQLPPMPFGTVAGGYVGVLLIGAFFLAAGLLCSLLTRHQVVAAMMCFAMLGAWVSSSLITVRFQLEATHSLSHYLSAPQHMRDFAAGILDTRTLVWYLSGTVVLLFTSIRLLEARRLR